MTVQELGPPFASGDPPKAATESASSPTKYASRWRQIRRRIQRIWVRLSLAQQFGITGAAVVLLGMSAIGNWVAEEIEEGVISNSAVAATLYMDAFIGPLVQELGRSNALTPEHIQRLDQIMDHSELKENVVSIKVWKKGAQIAYSNFSDIIGKSFTPTEHLKMAWNGAVSAELDGHSHPDDVNERTLKMPLLEIYAPIRETGGSRIIAVSEFYVRADTLIAALAKARTKSWGVVGLTALLMVVALYGTVRKGSNTIEAQQNDLLQKATQNAELRNKIEKAYWRADRLNEQFLRRLGADLHDGPAQLIGFALMSIDDLPIDQKALDAEPSDTQEAIRSALEAAIRDIRNLSRGLMLPELETMSLNEAAALIIKMHEERTGTKVSTDITERIIHAENEVKVCNYRFIQEALNNAFKHAGGKGQRVSISCNNSKLVVSVSDEGPGVNSRINEERVACSQLGLTGIRDRVETLNGIFEMGQARGSGTIITITLSCSGRGKR